MLVLGDAHADDPEKRRALLAAYRDAGEAIALQLGDLLHYEVPVPTWFIAGNNEDFDAVEALRRGDAALDGGANRPRLLASTAVDLEGVRVAGLSGNYAPTQYDRPRSELSGDRRRHFTREDVERAKALDDVDVLLVHEAPHGLLSFGYDPGCEPVDELLSALEPALCLVGHYHRHAEATIGGIRVVSLAPAWERYYVLDPATLALERYETPADGE
ncbi:metallophosphoesterase family protein [Halegenticoccus soli]|uniref:metallophosphoesterase family protein n=1 Tax=Halegenticoccus soli TaxID=1985678 RepID=UPI000C6DFF43|nr:metallophosphoesterase [Halegenticoccus soli]